MTLLTITTNVIFRSLSIFFLFPEVDQLTLPHCASKKCRHGHGYDTVTRAIFEKLKHETAYTITTPV